MPVTQADIDNLNTAIAAGERQVTIGGQSVTYQTIDSLIKARDDLRRELADQQATAAGRPRVRVRKLIYGGRGF